MVSVLERGDVTFFYRPTVQAADALEVEPGVQSFFLVLSPAGGARHRRLRIGKKRMPSPSGERLWGRVERVGSMQRVLGDQLEAETYVTKTRGQRYQPGARPIAQGCYAFVRHDDHTHLVYRVERALREEMCEEAPEEIAVPEAGSHLILFKRRPASPRAVWTPEGEPSRLDEEGAQLVLVGLDEDPEHELGIDVLSAA